MSSTSVSTPVSSSRAAALLDSLHKTRRAKEVLQQESEVLKRQLESLFSLAMPVGMRLERLARGSPIWARNFNVLRGNSRGTKLFEIASSISVEVNPTHVEISTWSCEAIPISEKTGKAMSGGSHGANSSGKDTVLIRGYLNDHSHDESTPDGGVLQLLEFVERMKHD